MNISRQIAGYLKSRELVLATLETCTAGAITAALAELSGAAASLDVGIVMHTPRALAAWSSAGPALEPDRTPSETVSESLARAIAETLLEQRAGHANVALASIGWLSNEEGHSAPVAHCFAWACRDRGVMFSASGTVLFSGRCVEVRRSIARRALLGLPRFVDSVFARERAGRST